MNRHCASNGLASLMRFTEPGTQRNGHDMRVAIENVLACNPMIHCGHRLHCTWAAAQLADVLSPKP